MALLNRLNRIQASALAVSSLTVSLLLQPIRVLPTRSSPSLACDALRAPCVSVLLVPARGEAASAFSSSADADARALAGTISRTFDTEVASRWRSLWPVALVPSSIVHQKPRNPTK